MTWLRQQKIVTPHLLFVFAWQILDARKRATANPLQNMILNMNKAQMTFFKPVDKLLDYMEEHHDGWLPDGDEIKMGDYRDPAEEVELEDFDERRRHDEPQALEPGSMVDAIDAINEDIEDAEAAEAIDQNMFEAAIHAAGNAALESEVGQLTISDHAAGFPVPVDSSDEESSDEEEEEEEEEEGEEGDEEEDHGDVQMEE